MDTIREQLLQDNVQVPGYQNIYARFGSDVAELSDRMFNSMWNAYVQNNRDGQYTINLTYWADQFEDQRTFNIIIMSLSKAGWILTSAIPTRNWAEAELVVDKLLEYISFDELEDIRAFKKFNKYLLDNKKTDVLDTTRVNGKRCKTGLVREGFMMSANVEFSYNTVYMQKYKYSINKNLIKSMEKVMDIYPELRSGRATYDTISSEILDYMLVPGKTYRSGKRDSDTRGRNIHGALKKVANHISCKDFRALLEIPSDLC